MWCVLIHKLAACSLPDLPLLGQEAERADADIDRRVFVDGLTSGDRLSHDLVDLSEIVRLLIVCGQPSSPTGPSGRAQGG